MGSEKKETICVVGLGYVGLPLALGFDKASYTVVGFDISERKIAELKKGLDSNGEEELVGNRIEFTNKSEDIKKGDVVIVAVPTPVTAAKVPDLTPVESASEIVGKNIKKGAIVVFESTVYPGVTEEVCLPILEKFSGLKGGRDFKIGYSPERINPGDKEHALGSIVKVVAGQDAETTEKLAKVYGAVTKAGVFKAANIKTAEAAKVIENIQRDLNIALVNELSLIFERMGIRTKDVLDAASTKWNFHRYMPGLVGGHCIGVDPYYLVHKAAELDYHSQVILAGRRINDYMPYHVVQLAIKGLNKAGKSLQGSRVLLLGLTFKKNVRDTRNAPSKKIIEELKKHEVTVLVHDPLVSDTRQFGVENSSLEKLADLDCIILVTDHDAFGKLSLAELAKKTNGKPVLIDVRNQFTPEAAQKAGFFYFSL